MALGFGKESKQKLTNSKEITREIAIQLMEEWGQTEAARLMKLYNQPLRIQIVGYQKLQVTFLD